MRRRRRVKPSGGVQMFSFLDAMICTMGALLVLLHAFARHGQIEIAEKAESRLSEAELKAEREDAAWRVAHLKKSRDQTAAELAEERQKLGHVEDHERRLRERLRELKIAADEMQRLDSTGGDERQQAIAELAAARARLRQARDEVEDARRKAQGVEPTYSVVPYEGPHSTRRRPIYIECRADSVVLQPEGVEFVAEDFAGLMGPGNPLASALRGMSEYLARQSPNKETAGEPYPLLLVRPEGIEAYYAARSALVSWGSEFGYELVGSDWKLTFPEPDPRLAELTREIVVEARQRHREYLAVSSQMVRSRNRPVYHARSRGGFAADPGSRGGRGGPGGDGWDSPATSWSRRGGVGLGGPNEDGGGMAPSGTRGFADSLTGGGGVERRADVRSSVAADGAQSGEPAGQGLGAQGLEGGPGGRSKTLGDRGELAATDWRNRAGATGMEDALHADRQGGGRAGDRQSSAAAQGKAGGQSPFGSRSPSSEPASDQSSGAPGLGSPDSQSAAGSSGAATQTQPSASPQSRKVSSMARTRGRDWGLPDAGPAAIAATRPIRVECHSDRLVIVPEGRTEARREISLGTRTQDSMDELVSNVWQHMKGWGVAGKGMYWRPTLVVDVKPGAADRYSEIKALLADSGLDIHERPPVPTAKKPAKQTIR